MPVPAGKPPSEPIITPAQVLRVPAGKNGKHPKADGATADSGYADFPMAGEGSGHTNRLRNFVTPGVTPPPASSRGDASREFRGEGCGRALAAVKKEFKRHYYFSDDDVIDVVLGAVAGNQLDNDPLWLYLIGPPSSGKTELLFSTQLHPDTFFVSHLSANSLISGYKDPPKDAPRAGEKPRHKAKAKAKGKAPKSRPGAEGVAPEKDYSLLPQLDGKVLVIKDFTVIHQMPGDARASILSQLRDAYDGFSSRKVGNADTKGYKSRFNLLAGMTPDIESNWSLNTLGERFLMYRIDIADRRGHARRALDNVLTGKGSAGVREGLQGKVKAFLDGVERFKPAVGEDAKERLLDLAEILSVCRTYVHRDRNDDMPCLPLPELGARVAKQLLRVVMSVALVRGRREVTDEELDVARRIALDSLPTNRRLLLRTLYGNEPRKLHPLDTFAAAVSRVSRKTVGRELENLTELGAVKRVKVKKGKALVDHYRLTDEFRGYCESVGGV